MENQTTLEHLKSTMYRMPLDINTSWNDKIDSCKNNKELMILINSEATVSEKDYFTSAINASVE